MACRPDDGARINSFALVSYVPDPLGSFLDQLRRDLVSGCIARSHITILPPRVLTGPVDDVSQSLHREVREFSPFRLELADIQIFECTSVIYLGIRGGWSQLETMHSSLNHGGLRFDEPYPYHPHITLAQDFGKERLPELLAIAKRRWEEFHAPKWFELDVLTFVQNTVENRWLDLEEIPLAEPVGSLRP